MRQMQPQVQGMPRLQAMEGILEMLRHRQMTQAAGTAPVERPTKVNSAPIAGRQNRNSHRAGFAAAELPIRGDFVLTAVMQDRFRQTGHAPAELKILGSSVRNAETRAHNQEVIHVSCQLQMSKLWWGSSI